MGADNHIEKMVVTPHLTDLREAEAFVRLRDRKIEELKRELDRLEIKTELYPGAEVYLDDGFFMKNCPHGSPSITAATS